MTAHIIQHQMQNKKPGKRKIIGYFYAAFILKHSLYKG